MQMDLKMDKPSEKFISRLQEYLKFSRFLHFTTLTKQDGNTKIVVLIVSNTSKKIVFQKSETRQDTTHVKKK
jgi:hypothetical protein